MEAVNGSELTDSQLLQLIRSRKIVMTVALTMPPGQSASPQTTATATSVADVSSADSAPQSATNMTEQATHKQTTKVHPDWQWQSPATEYLNSRPLAVRNIATHASNSRASSPLSSGTPTPSPMSLSVQSSPPRSRNTELPLLPTAAAPLQTDLWFDPTLAVQPTAATYPFLDDAESGLSLGLLGDDNMDECFLQLLDEDFGTAGANTHYGQHKATTSFPRTACAPWPNTVEHRAADPFCSSGGAATATSAAWATWPPSAAGILRS